MILLINLLGASEFKAQMVVPHGTVSVTVLVTSLVIPCSWRSLSIPGGHSALLDFAPLPWSLLSEVCTSLDYLL